MSKTDVAKKAGYNRSSFYRHAADPELDFDILYKYGRVIQYDFTTDFPEMENQMVLAELPMKYNVTPQSLQESENEKHFWKDKYYRLLEKYNSVLEELRNRPGEFAKNGQNVA